MMKEVFKESHKKNEKELMSEDTLIRFTRSQFENIKAMKLDIPIQLYQL